MFILNQCYMWVENKFVPFWFSYCVGELLSGGEGGDDMSVFYRRSE